MERRLALKLIAAGFAAPAAPVLAGRSALVSIAPLQAAAAYRPQFFTAAQFAAVDRLTELIIPADEQSGGASAAKVGVYIDVLLSAASPAVRSQWKRGLQALDAACRQRFDGPFHELTDERQNALLAAMAQNEGAPATALQRFFAPLKRMTIDGYYTSKIGIHDDLRYIGNSALPEFPGCGHPQHGA